jgi:hypothetical protein
MDSRRRSGQLRKKSGAVADHDALGRGVGSLARSADASGAPGEPDRPLGHQGARAVRPVGVAVALLLATAGCPSASPMVPPDPCDLPGTICTVAGTGLSLFDGDGRDALQTSFYYPLDVEFDRDGRPLILDFNNLRVRRLNEDGTIDTAMGLDYEDAPIDGALATETPLHHASDISMDSTGRLYVAGDHVPVVFLVGTDDRVHIVAGNGEFGYDGDGGPALEARMAAPFGVLPDDHGGFYISDQSMHVVRFVDPDGIIHTVAGDGTRGYSGDGGPAPQGQLNAPTRMALDAAGRLYICDTNNNAIRRIDRDGTIETFAGTGDLGYSGDGAPAASAELNTPYDIRFGSDGVLYVADTGNNVLRGIDAEGVIETVAGTGQPGFAGDGRSVEACQLNRPSGINFFTDGSLWIADTYNQRVRRVAGFLSLEPQR